jgi:DNA adenine methylase
MNSPIKYFGGKNAMSNKILEYFPKNYITLNYVEPFCGSAALLFHKEMSPIEIINDIDKNIYNLFKVLIDKDKFSEFKELCDLSLFSEDLNKEYKLSLKNDNLSEIDRAYKYFYVNRTSYNGFGGLSVSAVIRRNMSKSVSDYLSAIDGLYEIHNRLSKVIIHNTNAFDLIQKWDVDNTIIYCDSPYELSTRSSGKYPHDMTNENQDEYLNILANIKNAKLLISGYNCERYNILDKNGYNRVDIETKTQNTNRVGKTKVESLWFNY